MYNNSSRFYNDCGCPCCRKDANFNAIMGVINSGMDILRRTCHHRMPPDFHVLQSWQSDAQYTLRMISSDCNRDVYLEYLRFLTSIAYLSPCEQLNHSIDKLLNIAHRI